MRVLVTGANGYIGQGVVKALQDFNADVIATDFSLENIDDKIEKIETNIFKIDDPYVFFGKPDIVIHLAWRNGFNHNSCVHFEDLNEHYRFLCKLIDSNVRQIAVLGSMHEVGFHNGAIDENTPCNPSSLYGIAKNALREAVLSYSDNKETKCLWLRGFYIIGGPVNGESIFLKIRKASDDGKKVFPFTTGKRKYDFTDYELFCKQVAAASLQDEVQGIINCCSGHSQELGEVVEKYISDNGIDIKLDYGAYPDRQYDSDDVWGNNDRIKKIMETVYV